MGRTRFTQIRNETLETILIRRGENDARVMWCADCRGETVWLNAAETSFVCGSSVREIFRQVEAGTIHFQETIDRQLLVCERSLSALVQNPPQLVQTVRKKVNGEKPEQTETE